jgi:Fe2+ transport system protein FeoA
MPEGCMTLIEAPPNSLLRIVGVEGGEAVRRRLFCLGFHKDDVVRVESRAPFRGPLLLWNATSGCRTALGRGVAAKVLVQTVDGEE